MCIMLYTLLHKFILQMCRCYLSSGISHISIEKFQYSKCVGVICFLSKKSAIMFCFNTPGVSVLYLSLIIIHIFFTGFNTPGVSVLCKRRLERQINPSYFNTPGVSVLSDTFIAINKFVWKFQYSRCVGVINQNKRLSSLLRLFQYSRCVGVMIWIFGQIS